MFLFCVLKKPRRAPKRAHPHTPPRPSFVSFRSFLSFVSLVSTPPGRGFSSPLSREATNNNPKQHTLLVLFFCIRGCTTNQNQPTQRTKYSYQTNKKRTVPSVNPLQRREKKKKKEDCNERKRGNKKTKERERKRRTETQTNNQNQIKIKSCPQT